MYTCVYTIFRHTWWLPSGNQTWQKIHYEWRFYIIGKLHINGQFSIAMFEDWRITINNGGWSRTCWNLCHDICGIEPFDQRTCLIWGSENGEWNKQNSSFNRRTHGDGDVTWFDRHQLGLNHSKSRVNCQKWRDSRDTMGICYGIYIYISTHQYDIWNLT